MEKYIWSDGRIRLRLTDAELRDLGLDREALLRFDDKTRLVLREWILSLKQRGVLPAGELLAEIFPGRRGAVLQITPEAERQSFFLSRTDDLLAVFPLAKALGAELYRRLDGKGYYIANADEKGAVRFSEFALPCRVGDGVLKEKCRRIL